MFRGVRFVVLTCVTLIAGAAMVAAPGQNTSQPGQPTQGKVWVENRSRDEAIPVVIAQNAAMTLPVRLAGALPGTPPAPVPVQRIRQPVEYQTVTVPAGATAQDLTSLLNGPGMSGWEPSGIQIASGATTLIVLQRLRP
jgi:hypothetical protein